MGHKLVGFSQLAVLGTLVCSACDSPGAFTSDRISIVTRGAGPDLILVHGLAAHRDVWAGMADSLDDRYRLHLVQINGFGGAAPGANADGPVAAPVAEELARYIEHAALDSVALIGHSMGGSIAMMVAARHPELVGRVMAVDIPPFVGVLFVAPGASADSIRTQADRIRQWILATPSEGPGMLEQMIATMTQVDSARDRLLQFGRDSHRPTVANAMHEIIVTDLRPELPRIAAPLTVLYVVPAGLPLSPDEFDRAMRTSYSGAPNARLVRIDSSSHYIHIDQPGRFVREVDAFMRSVGGPALIETN